MDAVAWLTLADGSWSARLAELADFRLASCLALAAAIFVIGAWGVLARRNILIMLISIELMLTAVMLAFISLARAHVNLAAVTGNAYAGETGQVFALFIIAVAAAEAAVGLAIVIAFFRNRPTVETSEMRELSH